MDPKYSNNHIFLDLGIDLCLDNMIGAYVMRVKMAAAFAVLHIKPCHYTVNQYLENFKKKISNNGQNFVIKRLHEIEVELASLKIKDQLKNMQMCASPQYFANLDLMAIDDFSMEYETCSKTSMEIADNRKMMAEPSPINNNATDNFYDFTLSTLKLEALINSTPIEELENSEYSYTLWSNVSTAWNFIQSEYLENLNLTNSKWILAFIKLVDRHSRANIENNDILIDSGFCCDNSFRYILPPRNLMLYDKMRNLRISIVRFMIEKITLNSSFTSNNLQELRTRTLIILARYASQTTEIDLDVSIMALNMLLEYLKETCAEHCAPSTMSTTTPDDTTKNSLFKLENPKKQPFDNILRVFNNFYIDVAIHCILNSFSENPYNCTSFTTFSKPFVTEIAHNMLKPLNFACNGKIKQTHNYFVKDKNSNKIFSYITDFRAEVEACLHLFDKQHLAWNNENDLNKFGIIKIIEYIDSFLPI